MPDALDNDVQFGMHQRLAAADRDNRSLKERKPINAANHFIGWNWRGEIVVLVAICASQIAASHRNDVCQEHMLRGREAPENHLNFALPQLQLVLPLHSFSRAAHSNCKCAVWSRTR